MYIKKLSLKNYRNYDELNISFDENINILYGNNAQGKTNLIEAIYLSSTTKSQRGSKDKDIIRFGFDECYISLVANDYRNDIKIDYHLRKNKSKIVTVNNYQIKKSKEILGKLKVVLFSPEDLNIIKDGPKKRRKFIDMELCQIDKLYVNNLAKYNKILKERNIILKEKKYEKKRNELLDIYDSQLYLYGKEIIERRKKYISDINDIINDIHKNLTGNKEKIEIKYCLNTNVNEYEKKLEESRRKDLLNKATNVGPHRDDIEFFINDVDAKKYGSQGQQRTCALSLKLSEIEIIKNITKEKPILLLDDVLSELDKNRQDYLLESIKDVQTIITCTGVDEFIKRHFEDCKIFNIVGGKVK